MHGYKEYTGYDPIIIANRFRDMAYSSYSYGTNYCKGGSIILNKVYYDKEEALYQAGQTCYFGGWETAPIYMVLPKGKKLTKGFTEALDKFKEKYKEVREFDKQLDICYGRKSAQVTCPNCKSAISLTYAKSRHWRTCPVCHSQKIISDSNWKILKSKNDMLAKVSANLAKYAEKLGVIFVGRFEWNED